MRHPPLAPWHVDAPHQVAALGTLPLETGGAIADFRQSYVVHGSLDAAPGGVILICSAITGTHHRLDFLIGPGRALDPSRHAIIAADPIGNGLSTSPSNSLAQPGMSFPWFGIRDMVEAQRRLLDHLGVDRLAAVVGASMGGMQALQWAVSHPLRMDAVVAMTPMAKTSPWAVMVTEAASACLTADPAWTGDGFRAVPERGWRAWAALMNALVMRTPEALDRALDGHDVAAWFDGVAAQQRAQDFDATDFLYQARAYATHDVGATPGLDGDTGRALATVRARTLILAPPLDLFNPVASARSAAAAIPHARYVEIPSGQGHYAATSVDAGDVSFLNRTIARFLAG